MATYNQSETAQSVLQTKTLSDGNTKSDSGIATQGGIGSVNRPQRHSQESHEQSQPIYTVGIS